MNIEGSMATGKVKVFLTTDRAECNQSVFHPWLFYLSGQKIFFFPPIAVWLFCRQCLLTDRSCHRQLVYV